jgi:hypothetical protein
MQCTSTWLSAITLLAGVFVSPEFCIAETIDVSAVTRLEVHPETIEISSPRQSVQLIVSAALRGNEEADVTRDVTFSFADSNVASISETGRMTPGADGRTTLRVRIGKHSRDVPVTVSGQSENEPVSFAYHTLPVLAKAGCSGGACHGSPNGKAGFRLSLFGFEPAMDRQSLMRDLRSRRVNMVEPEQSLLLRKPTMEIPHAGGRRLRKGDGLYELLRDWIGEGCHAVPEDVSCTGIEVSPKVSRVLRFPAHTQQFRVVANFSDGSKRDVTHLSQFSLSNVNVADVTREGFVTGSGRGETAVIIRYLEFIRTPLLTFVRDVDGLEWNNLPQLTYVDRHIDAKLKQLQYLPSGPCSDEVFVRRIYLDVCGMLPTPENTLAFLNDARPDKRKHLIDELLARPEFAKYQAQKWGDLLRVSRKQIGLKAVFKYSRWLEGSVGSGMPYDEFARQLITASGSSVENPAANYYRTAGDTLDAMETTAQLFLGTRIQCAKCHNHPFERWTQSDYYGLAAFFNRLERRKTQDADEVIMRIAPAGEVKHPSDGRVMQPAVPVGSIEGTHRDRRQAFARWLTSKDNPYFARVEVNRIWATLLGRGIVEPFDDFRDSNPASNAPLLDTLAEDFVKHDFNREHIFRVILNSRTYQAASQPNDFNRTDSRYFSRYIPRRLTAEQLVDALGDVTGSPENFEFVPPGTRATWMPAPDLRPHDRARLGDIEFLKVFGQPERQSVCECDRGDDTSLGQALELLNGGFLHRKLENTSNRFHTALKEGTLPEQIVTDLYLRALSRMPAESELQASLAYIASGENKSAALEDVCWAIINKDEFLFQH